MTTNIITVNIKNLGQTSLMILRVVLTIIIYKQYLLWNLLFFYLVKKNKEKNKEIISIKNIRSVLAI